MIKKRNFKENKGFYRLSKKTIGNELYVSQKMLSSLYDYVKNGNDFDLEHFNRIIDSLNKIKNSARFFNSFEEIENTEFE